MDNLLRPGDKERLVELLESSDSEIDRHRARILLAFEDGMSMHEIAVEVDTPVHRVLYWRREYLKRGLDLFGD